MTIKTTHAWVSDLEGVSTVIRGLGLANSVADRDLDVDGRNLANSPEHCRLIGRGADAIMREGSASATELKKLLLGVVAYNTYGMFSEFAVYDWLHQHNVAFSTQVETKQQDILGQNPVPIDGRLTHAGVYFDVKAFGFHGRLAQRLKDRLQQELPSFDIFVERSWDISLEQFQNLIADAQQLAQKLQSVKVISVDGLQVRIGPKQRVSTSTRETDPYLKAEQNSLFALTSANQFTTNNPFMLVFPIHPWFDQNDIGINFADSDKTFTRALARRTFFQYAQSQADCSTICKKVKQSTTVGDAAAALSAMLFLNIWPNDLYPVGSDGARLAPSWLYLNPRARHPISDAKVRQMLGFEPHGITIDDFAHDNY